MSRCNPTRPVSMLQLHGTADAVIAYNGGQTPGTDGPYPAATTTAAIWRSKNGCTGTMDGARLNLAADIIGSETTVLHGTGCPAGGAVELLSMRGAGHIPPLEQPSFRATMWAFFAAHPRP